MHHKKHYDVLAMSAWKHKLRRLADRRRSRGSSQHALEPEHLQGGHHVRMLVDGPAVFAAMLQAMASAKRSIWLESYIFESDGTGQVFVEALAARAQEGLEVLIIVDAFGGLDLSWSDEMLLTNAGAQIRFFGRFNHLDLSRWLKRDHRKLLLIDGSRAFVGGINICDDYAAPSEGGRGWHDVHACITGPVCFSLAELFADTWKQVGGGVVTLPSIAGQSRDGEWAMLLSSNHRGVRTQIRSHLVHAMRLAEQEVLLASAYFVPDRKIVQAMEAAARRGVAVGLLVPGESDLRSVQLAGEHSYERLLASGVRIYEWHGSHMHVKAAVVDQRWCHVGSYNLDYMSLLNSLELVVEIVGDRSPPRLAGILRADMEVSTELDLKEWQARSGVDKLLSRVAYQFRRWL